MKRASTILIVDDEPSARDTLEALLFREGYDLAFAASGQEALARLDKLTPDVILLDVMMPGMDGFEVCQRLKGDEWWQHVPIILVTALDSKEDLVRGLDAGADEFLSKPVNGSDVRVRVRSMLRIKGQYDDLKETLRLRDDLSNMLVHDMRSPLTAILLSTRILERTSTSPDVLKRVARIHASARQLDSFINEMLVVAKMQHGKLILNRSDVDMNKLVRDVVKQHDVMAQSARIQLVTSLPQESRPLSLDANLFQRVLDNLLSNALKFSPPESTVTLRVENPVAEAASQLPSPLVRILVVDEGPGIPEEDRERIFDQFEVASLKQEGVHQVGLGLSFCKMVVEAHGGRILVESNEPGGSIFVLEI